MMRVQLLQQEQQQGDEDKNLECMHLTVRLSTISHDSSTSRRSIVKLTTDEECSIFTHCKHRYRHWVSLHRPYPWALCHHCQAT